MTKTILIALLLIFLVVGASIASYYGIGLPTERDQLSIRQSSTQNGRTIRGGGTSFGK